MARLDPPPTSSSSPPKPAAAVLETETTHVNLQEKKKPPTNNNINKNGTSKNGVDNHQSRFPVTTTPPVAITSAPAVIDIPPVSSTNNNGTEMSQMRTIELSTGRVREGFANGDVIVTLLPLNGNLPWITPPVFRPELVPEELMAQGLTVSYYNNSPLSIIPIKKNVRGILTLISFI